MAEETVRVDSTEDLDSLIQRLKRSGSKDVVLAVPEDARALQTLDQFNVLRREVKEAGLSLIFMGGNKTTRGLAKILGFPTRDGNIPGTSGGNVSSFGANETTSNPVIYGSEPTIPYPVPNGTASFANARTGYTNGNANSVPNGNGNGNGNSFGGSAMPFGMPEGNYVVTPNGNNGNGNPNGNPIPFNPNGNPSPFNPNANPNGNQQAQNPPSAGQPNFQDFMNEMQNFNPAFGNSKFQNAPPDNGLNRPGDVPVTKESFGNFFNENPTTPPNMQRNRPAPDFNFAPSNSELGSEPMSIDEARRRGLLGGNMGDSASLPTDEELFPGGEFQPGMAENEAVLPYDEDTGVASFRDRNSGGVRNRRGVTDTGKAGRNKVRSARPQRSLRGVGAGVAMPAALAGLGGRVKRILNPVQPVAPGTPRMTADIDPMTRRKRQATSRSYNRIALAALLLIGVVALALIILNITGSNNSNTNNTLQGNSNSNAAGSGANGTNGIGAAASSNPKITLIMKSQQVQNKSVQLIFSPVSGNAGPSTNNNQNSGNVGAMTVKPVDTGQIEVKGVHPAFGSKTVNTPARGKATIINYSGGFGYRAGAVLFRANNGVSYHIVDGVSIPAGDIFSNRPGTATFDIVADDSSGDKGNLPQGYRVKLTDAAALTTGPIVGGVNKQLKVISQADQQELQAQLTKQAQDTANTKLDGQLDKATQSLVTVSNNPPTCTFNLQVGQEAPNGFEGDCKVTYKGYIYNKSDLMQAVQQEVGTPGQQIDAATLTPDYTKGKLESKDGRDFYTVPVSYSSYATANVDDIKKAIANQPTNKVESIIANQFGNVVEGIDTNGYKADAMPSADKIDINMTTAAGAALSTPATTQSGSTPSSFGSVSGSVSGASSLGGSTAPTATPNP